MSFIDTKNEIGDIIKSCREVDILKHLLLKEDCYDLLFLPSQNLNTEGEEAKEDLSYLENLNESYEKLKTSDLQRKEIRILSENLVTSII